MPTAYITLKVVTKQVVFVITRVLTMLSFKPFTPGGCGWEIPVFLRCPYVKTMHSPKIEYSFCSQ